ncbi:PREDICTED: phosphatidylinositol-glycan biosynthesis class W protein-like isoform X1 [Atta colombica]|uniref:phosphatidylinositol-glycan biosynthesis class W protein-like isoform X1 n=1 Tax=Atta colombica TaxID=520822 RepID=UPI00084BCF88|nr:PREDICTED: phosphatidylinositol-glycan biosynthesis class W protein-like isoform X1 [Atta colombica]
MNNEWINRNQCLKFDLTMTVPASKEQYRFEQEAFVSNHEGTTPQAVIFTLLPTIWSIILAITTVEVLKKYIYIHKNIRVVIEFALTIIPTILCCTILSEYIGSICVIIILVSALNISLVMQKRINCSNLNITEQPVTDKIPFITNFRALTNIITAICILAVDFHIFPRKFAKTEVFGYSLMDTGVGLFVLANALVAPEARDFSTYRQASFLKTLTKNMSKCFRSCIPLLILGFGRFAVVEYVGYQKHVTEYGVHWNFFITLAIVKLFTSMITSTINSKYSYLSGIWILCMHEYTINTKDLKTWILGDEPRDDFFSANREGLISIPGYVGLYFVGVAIGRFIYSTCHLHATSSIDLNMKLSFFEMKGQYIGPLPSLYIKLFMISALIYLAILSCGFKISRRLANVGYCMWIVVLTTALLSFLVFIQFVLELMNIANWVSDGDNVWIEYKMKTSKNLSVNLKKHVESKKEENNEDIYRKSLEIFDAVNYNGLFFFLISNVMTGVVNMLMYTLYVKQSLALLILIIYMAVNIFSVLILYRLKIPIKL